MLPIRQLYFTEFDKYISHLINLDEGSKLLRFGYRIKDEAIYNFVNAIKENYDSNILFGVEDASLNIVAIGHISIYKTNKVELAFSVLKEYQNRGYGNALINRCIEWCQNRNITEGMMVCLPQNKIIQHLARKNSIKIHNDYNEVTAKIEIPGMTVQSLFHEAFVDNLATFDHIMKMNAVILKGS